ncbi:threonylcarbamoyl-AMP synthase [Bifidobacterium primatium]|uniref:L-threonylcarbamoyladenylate synthase n=1 Tax=Bifidobacterium primatium TaxID=2045438 RepID=A0A2M9H9M8_9BIFI|nr:L-threonylcarbamoyladenylate synthase [Bifidobacterium primatium]PJM73501.1 threonylcarbamoyl-AMP synthase [Bifidobacterium primatium]
MARIMPIDEESLRLAAEAISAGEIIVVPTDTVYGVACDPRNPDAVAKIFAAKHRPAAKSLQVLFSSVDELADYALDLPVPLDRLSRRFLPGAFSPICVARDGCPLATVRVDPNMHPSRTQGIRVPDSRDTLRILRATGPLAASSANLSGGDSAQTAQQAADALGDSVALYLDGGPTPGPLSSTVVAADIHGRDGIAILREGVIDQNRIRQALHMTAGRHAGTEGHDEDGEERA